MSQEHEWPPIVLVQVWLQPPLLLAHSLVSAYGKQNEYCYKNYTNYADYHLPTQV